MNNILHLCDMANRGEYNDSRSEFATEDFDISQYNHTELLCMINVLVTHEFKVEIQH